MDLATAVHGLRESLSLAHRSQLVQRPEAVAYKQGDCIMLEPPRAESLCADWQEVLTSSISYLSLHDLGRISACSKAAGEFLTSQLSSGKRVLARSLLRKALQQAADQQHAAQQLSCVKWLLLAANISEDVLAVEDYSNIPRVPLETCRVLVTAGVRVGYSQLVSAARKRVEGVGNWVEACRIQGVPSGVDELVEEISMCSAKGTNYNCWWLRQMQVISGSDFEDLLFVTLNMLGCEPGYSRKSASILDAILQEAPAAQQLSSNVCAQLLQCFMDIAAERGSKLDVQTYRLVFSRWARLPAMQQMSGNDLHPVLRSGVLNKLGSALVTILLDFPAAQLLSEGQIVDLITVTTQDANFAKHADPVQDDWHACRKFFIDGLCQLPAAAGVPSAVCQQLFHLAVDCGLPLCDSTTTLLCLAGMQQLDPAAVSAMIKKVINATCSREWSTSWPGFVIRIICDVPAAAGIGVDVMQELLQLAAGLGDHQAIVQWLMQLPAAQQLTATACSDQP